MIAYIPGKKRPSELIVLGGHYDSRTKILNDAISLAPGANDSGSQTAFLIELARQLHLQPMDRTVVFVSFAGEEQCLCGSHYFVEHFKEIFPRSKILAMLNFDIVGGDNTTTDNSDFSTYRVFAPNSERHRILAEKIIAINQREFPELKVNFIAAADRPERASDHFSFQEEGIPAVRIMENKENVAHQHSDQDLPDYTTPAYTANLVHLFQLVTLNLANSPE